MAHVQTQVQVDWSTASVSDGKLAVELSDKPSDEWSARFLKTTTLLNHGTWETIELKKRRVRIATVAPGEEEKVRHFLESAVFEANSAVEAESEPEASEDQPNPPESTPDSEMTDSFRSFADTESDTDSD